MKKGMAEEKETQREETKTGEGTTTSSGFN